MILPVTLAYASALIVIFFLLHGVSLVRAGARRAAEGGGANHPLDRVRVKGNFGPHVFLALVIMGLCELGDFDLWVVHGVGVALVGGRLLYASGFTAMSDDLQRKLPGYFAFACMVLVFAIIALWILSVVLGAVGDAVGIAF